MSAGYGEKRGYEEDPPINHIANAFFDSGLNDEHAPAVGTPAYQKMEEAAKNYINLIESAEKGFITKGSEDQRRKYHSILCEMIWGKPFHELSNSQKDTVSNFAAYLSEREDLVNTWH